MKVILVLLKNRTSALEILNKLIKELPDYRQFFNFNFLPVQRHMVPLCLKQ